MQAVSVTGAFVASRNRMLQNAPMSNELGSTLRDARRRKGLSQEQAAELIGISRPAYGQWESGTKTPAIENLDKASQVLSLDLHGLVKLLPYRRKMIPIPGRSDAENEMLAAMSGTTLQREGESIIDTKPEFIEPPALSQLRLDVPVYGFAAGASGEESDDQFYMNGQIANYVRRPPGITNMRGVFGVYVRGDSMIPKFEPGELIFATSAQQPAINDYVVVELHSLNSGSEFEDEAHSPARGIIKRLTKRSGSKMHFSQFNPAKELIFERSEIKALHRVLSNNDLFGS